MGGDRCRPRRLRGPAEPLAAVAAVFALGARLALYAGVLDATVPSLTPDRDLAPAAADRVVDASTSAGVVRPPIERAAATARPTDRELNATLRPTGWDEEWWHGPPVPETVGVDCARREAGVRVASGKRSPRTDGGVLVARGRGVSTVLDVAVCLLLVGAAVATLAVATGPVDDGGADADRTASTLATATTGVPTGTGRRAHNTLAGHLSTAAIENATYDDEPLTEAEYPGAVRVETAALTGDRVFVTARWEPYPGAPLQGRLAAGKAPPPDVDVAATSLTLDGGFDTVDEPPPESFRRLADAVAAAYVGWLFPTERTRAALVDARTAPEQAARYRTAARTLEADVDGALADAAVRQANVELTAALAARLESDLGVRYGSVAADREDVTLDEVKVDVRRWEP